MMKVDSDGNFVQSPLAFFFKHAHVSISSPNTYFFLNSLLVKGDMQDVWVVIFLSKCYASRQPIAKQSEFSCLRISTCLAQVDILQFSTM